MNSATAPNATNSTAAVLVDGGAFNILIRLYLLGLSSLAVCTVLSNGVFLFTFYKDPLKCLRTPSAIFIAGLACANFLTGLIVEPAYVGIVTASLVTGIGDGRSVRVFLRFIEAFSFVTITTSFLIMLALGVVQYLLISHPRIYDKAVGRKSAVGGVVFIFIYSVVFAVLPEMTGLDKNLHYVIDLAIHNILLTVVLILLNLVIYFKFRKLVERHRAADMLHKPEEQSAAIELPESERQHRQAEKDFVHGTIILTTFLIVTVWPFSSVVVYAMIDGFSMEAFMLMIIFQFFLLWKFAADPFVFAWRLRKYRKSVVLVIQRICPCGRPSLPAASYRRHGSLTAIPRSEPDDIDVEVTVVGGTGPVQQNAVV